MISEKYGRNVGVSWCLLVEIKNSLLKFSIRFCQYLQRALSIGAEDLGRRAVGDTVDYFGTRPGVAKILAIGHQSFTSDSALSLRQDDVIPVGHRGDMRAALIELSLPDDNHKLKDYSSLCRNEFVLALKVSRL